MRFKGTLIEWKDDRGFGFIEPAEGGSRVFCHIKAFDVRVRRPVAGDRVTYEVGKDAQGRSTAIKVRPVGLEEAQYQPNNKSRSQPRVQQSSPAWNWVISICLITIIGYVGWNHFKSKRNELMTTDQTTDEPTHVEPVVPPAVEPKSDTTEKQQPPTFKCDGRVYCSDMHSRAEAEFFLKNCPGTKMDGDNDGVPCEHDSRF